MALYHSVAYRSEATVVITGRGRDGSRDYLLLEDTLFYPEGGGQPADHGWIGTARVIDVQSADDGVRHFVDDAGALEAGACAQARLDWERRFDHMQQHTAQHLLTAVAHDRFGWPTTAFHLGEQVSDIELDVPALDVDALAALEREVAAEIRAARPVGSRLVSADELAGLDVRTRGLPDPPPPLVRLVEIEGVDRNTCGGTHVRCTSEIECVALLGTGPMRGGTRLEFVAGRRAARRMAAHEARNARLREILGAADDDLVDVARLKIDQLKDALRAGRRLGEALAVACADELAARVSAPSGPRVVTAALPLPAGKLLQATARRFRDRAARGLALVTAGDGPDALFALAAAQDESLDLAGLGRTAAEALDGRGGGSGGIYQGKARRVDRLEATRKLLLSRLD